MEDGLLSIKSCTDGSQPSSHGVRDQERIHIPQRDQEAAACLITHMETKTQILLRLTACVQPAHRVRAHLIGSLIKLNRVTPRFVHFTAVFGQQRGVAK